MRKIYFLFALLVLVVVGGACNSVSSNQPSPLPTSASRLEIPTQASALTTRPPATKRAITPTRPIHVNGLRTIALDELPSQARETLALIDQGGPFPYRQDGQIFQNREGILPKRTRGYYHEYTVETPGSEDRGARRIVTGEQGELYYTEDHYDSFKVIWLNE